MSEPTPVTIASPTTADGPIDESKLDEALNYIRPAVQADGGDIVLLGADNGVVSLQMVGACGGCPLSMMTLKAGIERILKDRVPGVREVHASADAPGTLEEATQSAGITLPAL
ncbi:MAG: NifU family protein [Acidimicrobiia bacterium]|nr:NifU family protein [Acidimicrobiia bacterium]